MNILVKYTEIVYKEVWQERVGGFVAGLRKQDWVRGVEGVRERGVRRDNIDCT